MATTYYNDIQKLYVAYFNRPADPAGLAFWETAVEAAKGDTTAVSAAFAGSAEYKAAYANMTNAQIVDAVYHNLFGRAAEDAGKAYWADLLDKKTITIDAVVTAVASGAQGTDKSAYNNKVTAAAAFTAAVDTDAEKAGYSGDAANKLAKAFLAGVTTDATLSAATTPAALNTTVAGVVAAGTPFTVAGALKALSAANAAEDAFLVTADGDNNAKTSATETSLTDAVTAASTKVVGELEGGASGTLATTYLASSDTVKAAIINDQVNANAAALTTAQTNLATANSNVAKVAGLQAAVDAQTAATASQTAAVKAQTAAAADLAAKEASFEVTQGVTVTFAANGTATYTKGSTTADLIVLKDGALVLADSTSVTEAKLPGVTALLNSSIAKEATDAAVGKANAAVDAATLNVHHLDVSGTAESDALAAVATKITTVDLKGAMPTEAQITTELATLKAKADVETDASGPAHTALTTFSNLVDAYHAAAVADPLVDAQTGAAQGVKDASTAITTFNKDVAALNAAKATFAQYQGYEATVAAAEKVFTDNGYTVTNIDDGTVGVTQIASTGSDLFIAGKNDATVALFGLQGKDALYIGTDYTLNTGKLSAGNDAVKEVFVTSDTSGNAQVVLEKTAFGSSAATPEVITITLTGVAATDVHLNNGIITVGSTTV